MSTSSQENEKHEKPWDVDLANTIQDYLEYLREFVMDNVDGEAFEEIAEKINCFSEIARSLRRDYIEEMSEAVEIVEEALQGEIHVLGEMLREIDTYEAAIANKVHKLRLRMTENTEGATTSNAAESKDSVTPETSAE